MRKKVLGLVMAALAVSTFGAFAQTETKTKAATEQCTGECHKGKECKKDKKDRKGKGERKGGKKGERKDRVSPFTGIQLTAEQQQQLEALKAERKNAKEEGKKADKEARAAQKKQFDEKVAQILTPEQYAQYQANCEAVKAQKKDKMHKKADKVRKGTKDIKAVEAKKAVKATN